MNSNYKITKFKSNKSKEINDQISIEEPLEIILKYKNNLYLKPKKNLIAIISLFLTLGMISNFCIIKHNPLSRLLIKVYLKDRYNYQHMLDKFCFFKVGKYLWKKSRLL